VHSISVDTADVRCNGPLDGKVIDSDRRLREVYEHSMDGMQGVYAHSISEWQASTVLIHRMPDAMDRWMEGL
jgi:hypothetical protein